MSANRYDDAYGVSSLTWNLGTPASTITGRPVLCEVWRASTGINTNEATKPQVYVEATLEIRMWQNNEWQTIGWNGQVTPSKPGEIRRYAYMRTRRWSHTIALDGWGG